MMPILVFDVNRKVKQTLRRMCNDIEHENVAKFFGISSHNNGIFLVEQSCTNGTLVEFFHDNRAVANRSFRYIVCANVARGMAYLHRQNLIHGNLSIDKCHVDSRWTVKIVDWEYAALYDDVRRIRSNQTLQATRENRESLPVTETTHEHSTFPFRTQATREKSVLHFLCDERYDGGSAFLEILDLDRLSVAEMNSKRNTANGNVQYVF